MPWLQNYDPLNNAALSTLLAAIPVGVLMGLIASGKLRVHLAASLALVIALGVAILGYHMPAKAAFAAAGYGVAFGLLPVGWMILNLLFLYNMTVEKGWFDALRHSFTRLAPDPRIQLLLVAFCFGSFFEGIAGFGAPVAVTAALLIQLGFKPLEACCLSLIANTAPVAFGSLGIPIITLNQVTGLGELTLSQMAGRQLPFFSAIIPTWIIMAYSGWRGMREVWPATLTAGVSFAIMQFIISNYHGPMLVDIGSALFATLAMVLLLKVWKPKTIAQPTLATAGTTVGEPRNPAASTATHERPLKRAWLPWIILVSIVFVWSQKGTKTALDGLFIQNFSVAGLHQAVVRTPPVIPADVPATPEKAVYTLNLLSTTGTGILLAAVIAGAVMGFSPGRMLQVWLRTLVKIRLSLITIAAMLALGFVTKYSGADATLGLALAKTGWLYPFFGTLLGWLGVALTGSDTASNVLFGSLQTVTAQQVGVSPVLMASANSVGGVMGKMVDAQSIVVASTAASVFGQESAILRRVFWHSIILAALVGVFVFLQAYVWPFTEMVVKQAG
ncbi:lactate permease [Roseimicrobium gellanilyticum]|uniref:L-lactate permease n=1 Tax=Roseimicrobium gellanilyticum TaxID=748857 RepID=A0A366HAZ5_9BACT|nr:L-lactate permease [Roseimicrobium gellanilyticum]RBP39079.1 lactate permease [Roseimicrobium gellanilyticum]